MKLFSIKDTIFDKTKINFSRKKAVIASKVPNSAVAYGVLGPTQSRTSFQVAEYNLGEISKVMDIEAYVRQAFNKHVELCLKEGYDISSRNEEATVYIKRRLREMSEVSGLTFDMVLRYLTQNIVSYSNAFLVKVRDFKRSGGMTVPRINGPSLPPVAAYYPMDPTSIRIKRDFHGKILKYWQRVPGNPIMPQFIPENIIHVYYDKKEGFAFGTPYIIPVLDDIRSLRRMEENVEMLVTQHLFPLYHYIVGTEGSPAEIYDDGTSEVDVIKEQIERMPTEGSIVTPERHEIKNLGAEGKALDAANYLKYFERRVLAGLGISDIALGRGDTANRATASTIDRVMTDRCKDFQAVIEDFINEYMFKELLFEGGFVIDEREDNFVNLKFREIDIDFMLKTQNHSVFKYEHHAITETEMRDEISRDPISDKQREDMYLERVEEPKSEIAAEAQLQSTEAKAVGRFNVLQGVKQKKPGSIGLGGSEKTKKSTENREKPTNQHGQKPAKTLEKKDYAEAAAYLDHLWYVTKLDIVDMFNDYDDWKDITSDRMTPIFNITKEDMMRVSSSWKVDRKIFDTYIYTLFNDLGDTIVTSVKNTDIRGDTVFVISGVFESLRFRLEDILEKSII